MDQETQSPTPETPSLSLQDLVVLLNIVRATAERGAIRADEMSTAGAVYDKLVKFLQASGAIATKAPEAPPQEDQTN
jgi:hypothetical protein